MWTCKTPINSCFAFGIHSKGISQKEAKKRKIEHRSCGDTQPLTLPEYGDRKTIIPLTVEKNSPNKIKQKLEKFKWEREL